MRADEDDWREQASCKSVDPELFFPGKDDGYRDEPATAAKWRDPRAVCNACPVRVECLEMAMDAEGGSGRNSRHGMYGGLTPRERWQADQNLHTGRQGGMPNRRHEVLALSARGFDRVTISAHLGLHPDSVSRYLADPS